MKRIDIDLTHRIFVCFILTAVIALLGYSAFTLLKSFLPFLLLFRLL